MTIINGTMPIFHGLELSLVWFDATTVQESAPFICFIPLHILIIIENINWYRLATMQSVIKPTLPMET